MAKSNKLHQNTKSRALNKFSSHCKKVCKVAHNNKPRVKTSKNTEWENAVCSVCMEFPHKSVLLLCSSYENGCRPYMCSTSHRFSNCLEQYKKAYTKITSKENSQSWQESMDNKKLKEESLLLEKPELSCPLCRGQVKGWAVVKPARRFFNSKRRTCVQENCSFAGTYKEIKKHVKFVHPLARPREVDPAHAEKWKKLENERDISDVLSTIRSTMPESIVIGDYVIENRYSGNELSRWSEPAFSSDSCAADYDSPDEEYFRFRSPHGSRSVRRRVSLMARLHARLLFGRRMGRLGR
ncbi:hypothetical protein OROHE_023663 [Orobanche hederae]